MTNPIVPWIGGKRRLVDLLLKRFPAHSCYVEVFAGGAAVYFARHPADVEILNDVNGDLVNLYRVVTHHLEEFVRQFKWALTSRQVFKWLQETRPETLTDIQRAARFFYLQQQSFGGKVAGQTFGTATTAPAINLLRIEENLSAAHLRMAGGTYVEQLDWAQCIDRYDRAHTLFYLDPPYWETEGYGVPFEWEQYELMATKLREIKGKAVISINDHPAIRACFKDFEMESLKLDYTVGGGANRVERGELVIYSWARSEEPAGLF
ncbi:DNA adenine methylase [Comamonas thiooxydans]|uniref:DNA adenine methylase n=1 Tax=Comamonas thiooxydans TaxID=363952 RepID=UPI00070C2CA3|nr:DNA adenine methylase [Comamonas thiooxydans]